MKIRKAKEIFDKVSYSSVEDYQTYPVSIYNCDLCGERFSFCMKDLDKHRFSSFSNLSIEDQSLFNKTASEFFLSRKIDSEMKSNKETTSYKSTTILNKIASLIQKLKKKKLSSELSKIQSEPDSFIDFYCTGCKRPSRIYYSSYLGGRHTENGYDLDFIID